MLICDAGCYNYSNAAAEVGAVYEGAPHSLSMKKHNAFYIGPDQALNVIRAYRDAVNRITEPYYMQLEDDVYTLKRIESPLPNAINGWAKDKSVVGAAEQYVLRHVTNPPYMYLGGFGGCVYETAFWKRILNLPSIEQEVLDMYQGADNYGVDYIFSTLLWRFGGTMGDFRGYIERFRGDAEERLARGEIEVLHGYKNLYGAGEGDLSWEEKTLLGDFHAGVEE